MGSVSAGQREDARLAGHAAHLLDGGHIKVGRELVWVEKEEVRAEGEVELAVSERKVRQLVR